MDPALWELLEEGDGNDEIAAIIRLGRPGTVPEGVRVVARFGDIATCRLKRSAIVNVRADAAVASLKAPHPGLAPDEEPDLVDLAETAGESISWNDGRRPEEEETTGRGVVVGVVDWGCDFAHPDFRYADGSTRLLALWDQRGRPEGDAPNRYGYGAIHTAEAINRALAAPDPYRALQYHPADADADGTGSHGTHVMGIAAGNGRGGGPAGVAPEADLVFVHLAAGGKPGQERLGDSATLLEAVDFIRHTAGDRPWVINLSMGRHGEQHDGTTLVEQALDAVLREAPNRAICLSAGNYYTRMHHAAGQLRPGQKRTLVWLIAPGDRTGNELQVWYPFRDVLEVAIRSPDGAVSRRVALGEQAVLTRDGQRVGSIYHRPHEPNTLDHQVNIFLDPGAGDGPWEVKLYASNVVDGRFHAWIERDAICPGCQSRFRAQDAVPLTTTGSICNGTRTLAAGAYNQHSPDQELGRFSSSGPTRDGRVKPDLCAPGVLVLSARSAAREPDSQTPLYARRSGTSMASPHVAGTVALMFQAAPRPLRIEETHNLLLTSTRRVEVTEETANRVGSGYLDVAAAVEAARRAGQIARPVPHGEAAVDAEELGQQPALARTGIGTAVRRTAMGVLSQAVSLGQIIIGTSQYAVEPLSPQPAQTVATLDEALRAAFAQSGEHTVIEGNLLAAQPVSLRRWASNPALPATLPAAVEFAGPSGVCAIVINAGQIVYFPSDPTATVRRWVAVPWLREFYALPDVDQNAQRREWIDRLAAAGVGYTRQALGNLSTPALRLLLAHFRANAMRVRNVNTETRRGAVVNGVTLPVTGYPLSEPECYLPVIAQVEGRMESINAWDRKAGVSLGPIQVNVQRGALFRFLWDLWERDPALFAQEFTTPLGWTMQRHDGHPDLLIHAGTPQAVTLHGNGNDADVVRNYGYFQSGVPGHGSFAQIDQAFRRSLAERFRNVVVWPHVQEILLGTTTWWLSAGLRSLDAAGIARLDARRPDRDSFVLKAMLLSAYVRFSGSLGPLLTALRPYPTVAEKLAHWREAVATWGNPDQQAELLRRLGAQQGHARSAHDAIMRQAGPAPAVVPRGAEFEEDEESEETEEWAAEEEFESCGCGEEAEAFESVDLGEEAEDTPQPTPAGVDTTVAVPPFTSAQRAQISRVLDRAKNAAALQWNQEKHPSVSGLSPQAIRAALSAYVDLDAVRTAIEAYNAGHTATPIDPGAPPLDAVFVEAVHQFQAKCFADRSRVNGKADDPTLDTLGFVVRTRLQTGDYENTFIREMLQRHDAELQAASGNEFTAANWYGRMVNPSFLGYTCPTQATTGKFVGLHVVLVRKLRAAERQLLSMSEYAGLTPVELGRRLGIRGGYAGSRPHDRTYSMHTAGLAIDINYTGNPWVAGQAGNETGNRNFTRAVNRAALLISGMTVDFTSTYLSNLARRPAAGILDELNARSNDLRAYLALHENPRALRTRLEEHERRGTAGVFEPVVESMEYAVQRWLTRIAEDLRDLESPAGVFGTSGNRARDPRRGFVDLHVHLVTALRDHAHLAWGAVDFGGQSGDIMHFDCRADGVGRTVNQILVAEKRGARPARRPRAESEWADALETVAASVLDVAETCEGDLGEAEESAFDLVAATDQAIAAGAIARSAEGLIRHILSVAGGGRVAGAPAAGGRNPCSPALLFDSLTTGRYPALRQYYTQRFEVAVGPGMPLRRNIRRGDLVVRRALGEGSFAHGFLVAGDEALDRARAVAAGLIPEGRRAGLYVQVVETFPAARPSSSRYARWVAGSDGRVGRDTLVLRLRPEAGPPGELAEDLYSPTPARAYAPAPAQHVFPCRLGPLTVLPATQWPTATADPAGAIRTAFQAVGVSAAATARFEQQGGFDQLRPIAALFGADALTELLQRLRYTPEQLVSPPHSYDTDDAALQALGVTSKAVLLTPRVLLAIPGHFRELARRAPDAREAFALENLGWLLMEALRSQIARTGTNWWLPPAPAFVTRFANPLPPLSTAVQTLITQAGLVDANVRAEAYEAQFTAWSGSLAGREWRLETGVDPSPSGAGLPFYQELRGIVQAVDITPQRRATDAAWQARLRAVDRTAEPLSAQSTRLLTQCANDLIDQQMQTAQLQGLEMAYRFPERAGGTSLVRRLRVLGVLQPVFERVFLTIRELGWNDLLYQSSGAGCFRGKKIPPNRQDPLRHHRLAREWSEHSLGAAVDFNAHENKQVRARPAGSMEPRIVALFEAFYFRWGGCFTTPDPMHFEYGA